MSNIYTKTIDPSVQGGIDKSIVIEPIQAYQKKFDFGNDWTEIRISMFLSAVTTADPPNTSIPDDVEYSSGGSSPDTKLWVGINNSVNNHKLPSQNGNNFVGLQARTLDTEYSSADDHIGGYSFGNNYPLYKVFVNDSQTTSTNAPSFFYIRARGSGSTTNFATLLDFHFKVTNKGTINQTINTSITCRRSSSAERYTDVSDLNLTNIINAPQYSSSRIINSYDSLFRDPITFTAIDLPDSFFFYNPFQEARIRIHAIAVKKIS